ncbi:competence protein ComEA [Promicromonospora soli]|uniref:Competence protein ComEA n=1 Tax=Promicromonospora soli TaxID=2035533 RepID=A0A919FKU1_9MICO|nr:competence protein ComEA [Promicromonospora soli]
MRGSGGPADPPAARPAVRSEPRPAPEPAAQDAQARADADELVARLRARRSTSGVAAAYAAAHGHPADPRAEDGARRWALTGTTAVVAVVAVLMLGLGVAAFSMRGDDVDTLAPVADGEPSAGEPASPFAESGPEPTEPDLGAATAGATTAGGGLLVHVVGEVAQPGLVTLPDGARVADAVTAAGGVTRKADLTAVNLARTVVDGEQLYVPGPGEPVPRAPVAPGTGDQGTANDPSAAGGAVDINSADAVALEALPGVGPSIAQAIVEWRETNGPFASVDELEDVPGVGPATLDEIRESARVGP